VTVFGAGLAKASNFGNWQIGNFSAGASLTSYAGGDDGAWAAIFGTAYIDYVRVGDDFENWTTEFRGDATLRSCFQSFVNNFSPAEHLRKERFTSKKQWGNKPSKNHGKAPHGYNWQAMGLRAKSFFGWKLREKSAA
jgi:hypothetical protein